MADIINIFDHVKEPPNNIEAIMAALTESIVTTLELLAAEPGGLICVEVIRRECVTLLKKGGEEQ